MNSSKIVIKVVKICATILVCVILFAGAVTIGRKSYELGYRIYTEPAMESGTEGRQVSVEISAGMSNREIAALIEDNGLCRSQNLFYIQLQLSEYKNSIKPGYYVLSTTMKPNEILDILGGKNLEEDEEN